MCTLTLDEQPEQKKTVKDKPFPSPPPPPTLSLFSLSLRPFWSFGEYRNISQCNVMEFEEIHECHVF